MICVSLTIKRWRMKSTIKLRLCDNVVKFTMLTVIGENPYFYKGTFEVERNRLYEEYYLQMMIVEHLEYNDKNFERYSSGVHALDDIPAVLLMKMNKISEKEIQKYLRVEEIRRKRRLGHALQYTYGDEPMFPPEAVVKKLLSTKRKRSANRSTTKPPNHRW